MKKSYKTTVGVFALAAVALTGSQLVVNAYQGDYTKQGPSYSEERHTTMTQAFDSGDYNAWKEQMDGRGRVTEVVTADNFEQFKKAHQLALEGKTDEANALREELGLRTSNGEKGGHGHGKGEGKGRGNGENRGQNKGGHLVDADGDGTCDNNS
ncbi:MAG: hypothetical protein U9Q12_02875 [Patescibacteria group bacterium]|nr:hypothetical protein [Patescibacteria group bacterium]